MLNRLFVALAMVSMGACAGVRKHPDAAERRWECASTPSYDVCFAEPGHDGWQPAYRRIGAGGSYAVVYAAGLERPKRRGMIELWFIRDKAGEEACRRLLTEDEQATASPRRRAKIGVVRYDYRTTVDEEIWPSRVACRRLDRSGLSVVVYGMARPGWERSMRRAVDLLVETAQVTGR